jgi:hypothetical protein
MHCFRKCRSLYIKDSMGVSYKNANEARDTVAAALYFDKEIN